eukprot:123136_1
MLKKKELQYDQSNPSESGLFYYLGTNGETTAYTNPGDAKVVNVSSSPLKDACKCSATSYVGLKHGVTYCITKAHSNPEFAVDLRDKFLLPTGYALRNYSNGDRWWILGWNLEATNNNGKTWEIIDKRRDQDSLKGKGTIAYFPVRSAKYYNQFRIVMQQDSNEFSEHGRELHLSGSELYDHLLYVDIQAINTDMDEKQPHNPPKPFNADHDSLMQKMDELGGKIDAVQTEVAKINQNVGKLYTNPKQQKVKLWLENTVELREYYGLFIENGIVDLSTVALLNMETIKTMGIDKVGHQMKLLNAITKLKQTNGNEGKTAYK